MPSATDLEGDDSGAATVRRLLAGAYNPVEVFRTDRARGEQSLQRFQVPEASVFGAVASRLGGLVFDHGWVRLLGAGSSRLPRDLAGWNGPLDAPRLPGATLVADDALGGFFALDGGAFGGKGGIHYFSSDEWEWEDMDLDYQGLLRWACVGGFDGFYEGLRWPDWELEVAALRIDQGIEVDPYTGARTTVTVESMWRRVTDKTT